MNIPKKLEVPFFEIEKKYPDWMRQIRLSVQQLICNQNELIDYLQAKEEASKEQYIYTCSCSAVYDPELKNCPACGEKTIDNGRYLCYTCNQWGIVGEHKCEASKGECACSYYDWNRGTPNKKCMVHNPPEHEEILEESNRLDDLAHKFNNTIGIKSGRDQKIVKFYELEIKSGYVSKEKIKREANRIVEQYPTNEDFRYGIKRGIKEILNHLGLGE